MDFRCVQTKFAQGPSILRITEGISLYLFIYLPQNNFFLFCLHFLGCYNLELDVTKVLSGLPKRLPILVTFEYEIVSL